MSDAWYYAESGQQRGPVTSDALRQLARAGRLRSTDLVWKEGMRVWVPASKIRGLFPAPPRNPPATSPGPSVPASDESNFWSRAIEGGKVVPALGALFGLVADFLQPLAPINGYLFAATSMATIALAICWFRLETPLRQKWHRVLPHRALISCVYLNVAFAVWLMLQLVAADGNEGLLASHVEQLAKLQQSLLHLRKDVASIKQDTTEIKRNTADIKEDTTAIREDTKAIREGVEAVGKSGGIIPNAATPAELYHNAKIYELRADFGHAFEAYEKYVATSRDFIDPIDAYLRLLRQQRGQEGALVVFEKLVGQFPQSNAIKLVSTRLMSGDARRARVAALVDANPDYAPMHLELADCYSPEELEGRSKIAAERELDELRRVVELHRRGEFLRHYLDKKFADERLADVRARLNATHNSSLLDPTAEVQFRLAAAFEAGGRRGSITIMDRFATAIHYSFDGKAWYEASGFQIQGAAMKWAQASTPYPDQQQNTVFLKYHDNRNLESKVYRVAISAQERALEAEWRKRTAGAQGALSETERKINDGQRRANDAQRKGQEILQDVQQRIRSGKPR